MSIVRSGRGGTTLCYPDKFLTDSPEIKCSDFHLLVLLLLPGKFEDKLNLWEYLVCWLVAAVSGGSVVATQDHQTQTPCIRTKHCCLQ